MKSTRSLRNCSILRQGLSCADLPVLSSPAFLSSFAFVHLSGFSLFGHSVNIMDPHSSRDRSILLRLAWSSYLQHHNTSLHTSFRFRRSINRGSARRDLIPPKENQIAFRILGKLRSTHPPDRIARAHTRTETVSRSINSVNHREDGGRDRVLIPTTPARHQEAICFSRLMKARMEAISDPTSGNANQNSSWFTLVIVHDNHARLDPHQPVIVNCTIFKHSNQHRFLVL